MRKKYITIIKEKGEFDFEVSALVGELSYEEYKELKSMLITAIGTMETIRRAENNVINRVLEVLESENKNE